MTLVLASSCAAQSEGDPGPRPVPADIINLTNWKITLPVAADHSDRPIEVFQPDLANYQSEYFEVSDNRDSVVFRANAGGAIQPGSEFPRSELREMTDQGAEEAGWSNSDGVHTMSIREAVTHLPARRPSIVAGQIHDDAEYIVLVRLDGNHLYAKADDMSIGDLDADYQLGTIFDLRFEAMDGGFKIYYNGQLKVDYQKSCSTCYFKAGAYLQTNTERGEDDADYGEVKMYALTINQSPST